MSIHPGLRTAILIEDLSKTYRTPGGKLNQAVQHLNLEISSGQVFGFLGANGAGKTTTIKTLCGLVLPDNGRVAVNGYDVTHEHNQAMRQIGAVLEGTRNIYWRLSAWENLIYFGRLKGSGGSALKMLAERLLRELDLWEKRDIPTRLFSRGMQQKVAIACSLIADPPIVLLDEPTLGLDIQAAYAVKDLIRRLVREQGKTVILTTHQLDIAQELCDRVAIMRQGQLLTNQPLDELLRLFQQKDYQIKIKAWLTDQQARAFAPLTIVREHGATILSGQIQEIAELHKYLTLVQDLALPLGGIVQPEVSLEEVFLRLMQNDLKGVNNEANATDVAHYTK